MRHHGLSSALRQRRACRAKRNFQNRQAAEAAVKAEEWHLEDGVTLRVYKCPCCPWWHMTSQSENAEKDARPARAAAGEGA